MVKLSSAEDTNKVGRHEVSITPIYPVVPYFLCNTGLPQAQVYIYISVGLCQARVSKRGAMDSNIL